MNTVSPKMIEDITPAIEQLTNHQRQLDMDGTFVGVSRQALDEVLAYTAMLNARDPYEEGDVERVARVLEPQAWKVFDLDQDRDDPSMQPTWDAINKSYGLARAAITALIQSEGGVRSSLDASADADRATHEPSQVSQSRPSVGITCAETGE